MFMGVIRFIDIFIYMYLRLSSMWPPLKIRTPQNSRSTDFGHPTPNVNVAGKLKQNRLVVRIFFRFIDARNFFASEP